MNSGPASAVDVLVVVERTRDRYLRLSFMRVPTTRGRLMRRPEPSYDWLKALSRQRGMNATSIFMSTFTCVAVLCLAHMQPRV
jgi:hypothetical protein